MANEQVEIEDGGAVVELNAADVARLRIVAGVHAKAKAAYAAAHIGQARMLARADLMAAESALSDFALEIFAGLEPG